MARKFRQLSLMLVFSMLLQGVGIFALPMQKASAAYDPALYPEVIASGDWHSLFVGADGKVRVSGYDNGTGAMGLGSTITKYSAQTEIPGLSNVIQVTTYGYSSYALLQDGTVKSWGRNDIGAGQLGFGNESSALTPTTIPNLSNVKQIEAGMYFVIALLNDGTLKGWGTNISGELAGAAASYSPVTIPGITNVKQISVGDKFVLALLNDGTVRVWGENANGQLGLGDNTKRYSPTLISGLTGVTQVAAGSSHALALLQDGSVKSWGYNGNGQLGLNSTTSTNVPTTVPGLSNVRSLAAGNVNSAAVLNDDSLRTWGQNTYGQLGLNDTVARPAPTAVPLNHPVAKAYIGKNQIFYVTYDRQAYGAGYNSGGQLGVGDQFHKSTFTPTTALQMAISVSTVTANLISGPNSSSSFLLNDGQLWAWGSNSNGQLGLEDMTDRATPTLVPGLSGVKQLAVGSSYSIALMEDGTVKAWGGNGLGQLGLGNTTSSSIPTVIPGLTGVKQVVAGYMHAAALMEDGTVKTWGYNSSGQAGLGDTTNRTTPTVVPGLSGVKQLFAGDDSTFALMIDGSVKAWGKNSNGQLGLGHTTNSTTPSVISGLTNVKQLTVGYSHNFALMEDGTIKAWGYNAYGQLGLGDTTNRTTPTVVAGLANVKQLVAGYYSTYVILEDETVKAWGNNNYGQLGLGDSTTRTTPTVVTGLVGIKQLVNGSGHTLALTADGTIKAWGYNQYGQLGIGYTYSLRSPAVVNGLSSVKQVAAGSSHSLALLEDGTVKSWGGYNAYGQLGFGDQSDRPTPTTIPGFTGVKQLATFSNHTLALLNDGTVKAWGYNYYGQLGLGDTTDRRSPTTIPGLSGVKQLIAGNYHSFALMEDGTVKAWGYNYYGQLGLGDTTNRLSPTTVSGLSGVKQLIGGGSHSLALMADGIVQAWGYNVYGQLGLGDTTNRTSPTAVPGLSGVKQLIAGGNHSVALMEDGTVKAWGYNNYGQLGLGDTTYRTTPIVVPGLTGVKQLIAGGYHTLAIMLDGTVMSWGNNGSGQLGLGDTTKRLTPTSLSGLTAVKQIAASSSDTFAIMEDGTVKAWGDNYMFQTGRPKDLYAPVTVTQSKNDRVSIQAILKGPVNEKVSIRYYLDGSTVPQEQQTVTLTDGTATVNFQPAAKSIVANGTHTVRVLASTTTDFMDKTTSFNLIDGQPGDSISFSNVTTSGVTVTASSNDSQALLSASPYRITVGGQTSGWVSYSSSGAIFNAVGLSPNAKIDAKFEVKDVSGTIRSTTKSGYTAAATPALSVQQSGGQSPKLMVTDANPSGTKYQITSGNKYVSSEGELISQPVSITLPTKSLILSKLALNRTYSFKVRAINEEGVATSWSNAVNVGAPVTPPAVPKNIKAQPTSSQVTLSWSPVSGATQYDVEIDNNPVPVNNGRNLSYVSNGLAPNTLHQYRVRAVKDGVAGPWSAPIMQRTLMVAPVVPINIVASATAKTVTITWNAVQDAAGYEAEWDGQLFALGKQQTFKQNNLPLGSRHAFRVRALNASGAGPWSAIQIVNTTSNLPAVPVPSTPVVSDNSVQLRWDPAQDALSYEVQADGVILGVSDATTASFTGLAAGSSHQYFIRAVNELGAGAWSAPISVTTNALATPTGIIETISDTSIKLNWTKVEGATSYEVEADGAVTSWPTLQYQASGLASESVHTYRIRAMGPSGNSGWSEPLIYTTLPPKPAVPLQISATASKNQVYLSWGAVAGALGYDVEIDGAVVVDNFSDTSYTDSMLDPFTQHQYRIRARTDAIEGDWSELISLRTLPEKPAIPSDIAVTSSANIVTLSWTQDPTVTKYEVEVDGQVFDAGNKASYKHRRVLQGSEHKYRIRTTNVSGIGDWSGYIINNTIVAKLSKTNTVDLGMVGKDIMDFSRYTLKVTYDPNAIEITDLSTLTGSKELTTGRIAGTDVIVSSFRPGEAVFTCDKAIALNESWTGVINSIQLKAKVSGGSSITYSVIEKPN